MKNKIAIAVIAAFAGIPAFADVLYWQVNLSDATITDLSGNTDTISSYAYAYLRAKTGLGNDTVYYYVDSNLDPTGNDLGEMVSSSLFSNGGYAAGDLSKIMAWESPYGEYTGSMSALSFFIELYDTDGTLIASTLRDAVSYDNLGNLVSQGFNANFAGINAGALGSNSGAHYVTPEPCGGLLMLAGAALLGLRRRRFA